MGDDTWLTVFPTSFHPEMTHDFDSFNVEDLHTVDNGVIANLFPLLTNATHAHSWDFLIGHFLGVDHVGHRVGPDHPTMLSKQQQMNDVLKRVVDALHEDTLLIVLGDHGMDRKGDHGGDGDLEVSAGLWVYSKGPALSSKNPPTSHLPHKTFPGEPSPHRSVQQIDLVPTLSLLLGLPIPFNNLGTVIPELFWRDRSGSDYAKALDINARQVHAYLNTYRNSPSGGELDGVWSALEASWTRFRASKPKDRPKSAVEFTRLALETCRSLWARFNPALMVGGLGIIALSLIVGWGVYGRSRSVSEWDLWIASLSGTVTLSAVVGAALAAVAYLFSRSSQVLNGITVYQSILFGASIGSGVRVLISAPPKLRISWTVPVLLLHSAAFLSNSYTFWEDRAIPFFLLFTLVPPLLTALSAPTAHLRHRILAFAALFAACVRLMAVSTVCREEQHPWCRVTFFSGSGAAEPPALVRVLLIPAAILVPYGIRRVLAISKSDNGIASFLLSYVLPPALIAGSACWLLEWFDASGTYEYPAYVNLRQARTILAWTSVLAVLAGTALWALVPVALHVSSERAAAGDGHKTEVRVLGFANAYGAPFAVLWGLALAPVWLAAQPSAQISLALATAALLAHLELVDAARDARALHAGFAADPAGALARLQQGLPTMCPAQGQGAAVVTLDEVVPLALLAQLVFFASGHQATLTSLQWKTAFVLTPTVSYPASPLLVILNTFGPTALLAFGAPLLGIWNVAPLAVGPSDTSTPLPPARKGTQPRSPAQGAQAASPKSQARVAVLAGVRAALGTSLYFGALLLGSALSAAWLRRHLMVWKVFAPRYMLGAVELLCVDVAVLVGLWLGVGRIVGRITRMFALPAPSPGGGAAAAR
jgi:phosphatidylinositol glycan class O